MDFHHDRIRDNTERVVVHSRVSLNSYNVNTQVNYKVKATYRVVNRQSLKINPAST
jgi:hypothetical protein